MDDVRPTLSASASDSISPLVGLRRISVASWAGLIGQIVIWGSVLALWILGSIYANIPTFTFIAYGAYGITIPAATIFLLNLLLILGAAAGAAALQLEARGLQAVAKAPRRIDLSAEIGLATLGAVGFGMFAAGWAVWLGSFAPPGSSANPDTLAYAPVLASNLAALVNLLLFSGGVLGFVGMLGVAMAGSKVGTAYDEAALEVGGILSALPVVAIIGYALALIGLHRGAQKIGQGWVPPPPPPPPAYFYPAVPPGYLGAAPVVYPPRPGSWDAVAAVLVVCLVLVWAVILPFSLLASTQTYGPGNTPIGGPASSSASAASGPSLFAIVFLFALVATALIVPIAVVRNRRKRQRLMVRTVAPLPPPPPPPVPPPSKDDPLDHLV